jgi:hypothetical protein
MRVDTVRKLSRGSRRTSDHQDEPAGGRDHRDAKERLNLRNHCNFVILFRAACLLLVKIPARGVQLGGLYGDLAR